MTTLPAWFQILIGIVGILGFVGMALAFLLVIWPSIRRQNRLGKRFEEWIDGDDAKKLLSWMRSKVELRGDATTREAFSEMADRDKSL